MPPKPNPRTFPQKIFYFIRSKNCSYNTSPSFFIKPNNFCRLWSAKSGFLFNRRCVTEALNLSCAALFDMFPFRKLETISSPRSDSASCLNLCEVR